MRKKRRTGIRGCSYAYPACELDDLNYYKMNGMYYEVFDRDRLLEAMYLGNVYGLQEIRYSYGNDTVLHKFTVYWYYE